MEQSNITGPMERAEAQALTDRIRNAVDSLWQLLLEAHDRRAWKALGYKTWDSYVAGEFSMSTRRSYQLLDHGAVNRAIAEATGENVNHGSQISERAARDIKNDLPAVTTEIKQRVDAGQEPAEAVKETVDAARGAKARDKAERDAKQAEHDRQREEARAALPQGIKDREEAKQQAIAERKAKPVNVEAMQAELAELREANASYLAEIETLKADLKKFGEMRVQFEQGGFEKVVAGKDNEIRALETRLYSESADKASWMKSAKFWQSEAKKLGYSNDALVDIETGEVTNG